jgi:hypothetical protein
MMLPSTLMALSPLSDLTSAHRFESPRQRVAMQLTGHKTPNMFERYNIVSAGDLREAAKRLDAAAGTISGTIEQNR